MYVGKRTIFRASLAGLVLTFASFGYSQSASSASSESGTLVMVGRSANAVVVSVDSKITNVGDQPPLIFLPATPNDGDRKLVDVGVHSACAIDANLGLNTEDKDVSAAIRRWVALHPKMEASEAFDDLLDVTAETWDRNQFPIYNMPNHRTIGSVITELTCGDFVDGHPVIVHGQIEVVADGVGGQLAAKSALPHEVKQILFMGGITFEMGVSNSANALSWMEQSSHGLSPRWLEIKNELRANPKTVIAFENYRQANPEANPSNWELLSIKDLFEGVFAAVETDPQFSVGVGSPNNARIILPCGRFATTVEGEWPTCPAPPPQSKAVKKHR